MRIYYGDGTTWEGDVNTLPTAPSINVIAVLIPQWSLWFGKDWYWYRQGEWFGGDLFGLLDHLLYKRAETLVFAGRTIPDDDYKQIITQAIKDRNELNG